MVVVGLAITLGSAAGFALHLRQARRHDPSLAELRIEADRRPSPAVFATLVQRCLVEKRLQEALDVGWRGAERFPESAITHNAHGIALAEALFAANAHQEFERAIALDPRAIDPYVNLGKLAYIQGDFQTALNEYDRATTVDAKSVAAWRGLGEAAGELKHLATAHDAFDTALRLSPNDPQAHAAYGCFLTEVSEGTRARPHLEQALQLGYRSGRVYASLTMACADQPRSQDDLRKALEFARLAEQMHDETALLSYGKGLALERLGRYSEALASFLKVTRQTESSNGAWIGMSQCYRALGKRQLAASAAAMGERVLNERLAVDTLEKQIQGNPTRLDLRERYAALMMAHRSYIKAADVYRYVAEHSPDHPEEWLKVAVALERGGQSTGAREVRELARTKTLRPHQKPAGAGGGTMALQP